LICAKKLLFNEKRDKLKINKLNTIEYLSNANKRLPVSASLWF